MYILFPSQVNQPRNQEVVIGTNAPKQMAVSVVAGSNCALRVGGQLVQSATLDKNDYIELVFSTKVGYAEKDTFEFLVNGERSFFVYSTEDDPSPVFDPYYIGKSFLDTVTSTDGSQVDYIKDNSIKFVSETGEEFDLDLNDFAPPNFERSKNVTFMLDNRSGEVYKIDVDNRVSLGKLSFGSPAVGMVVAKNTMGAGNATWLTLQNGRVICVDENDVIVKDLSINGVATGIDTSLDGRLVAIADTTANQISIYENLGNNNWHSTRVPGTGYPYDVFVDAQKNIWVTSKLGSQLTVFPFGSRLPIQVKVGKGQKTIKQLNDRTIVVVCTESDELVMVDTRNKSVVERVSVPVPMDVTVIGKNVYIANAHSEVLLMPLTGGLSAPITPFLPATPTIYSLDMDKNSKSLIIAKMYSNTPTMLKVPNRIVDFVAFEGPPYVSDTKKYISDSVKIRGIETPVEVYTPKGLDLELTVTKDGQISPSNKVESGDTVKFEFLPTGLDQEAIVFPILLGNYVTYFDTKLKLSVADLRPFRFHNAMLTDLSLDYKSNEIRISGLLQGQTSEFILSRSHPKIKVEINGQLASAPYSVKNDDLITIKADLEADDFDENNLIALRATCEDFTTNWQILFVQLKTGELVTKPFTSGLPLQSLNWDLGSWGEISVFDSDMKFVKTIGLWDEDVTNVAANVAHEVLVCDYSKKKIFSIDSYTDTSSFASVELESGPFAAVRIGDRIYASLPDARKIGIFDSNLNLIKYHSLSYTPYGVETLNSNLIVVREDGKLYEYDISTMYVVDTPKQLNGTLLNVEKNGSDLYINDFESDKIKVVRNGMLYKSYQVGGNPTRIAFDTTFKTALVVNNFDNSATTIDLQTETVLETLVLDRPVHDAVYFNGDWRFIDMQTTSVVSGFHKDNIEDETQEYVTKTLKQNSGLLVPKIGGKIYVLHLASEYVNILENRVYASSDDFIPQMNVSSRDPVTSNPVTFNYMSRPQVVAVPDEMGYSLIHNGVEVGVKATVKLNDTIAIRAVATKHKATLQEIILSGQNYIKSFQFQTEPNYIPDFIKFETIFGALPGEMVYSSIEKIEGLTDDTLVDIQVDDRDVIVHVNGQIVKEYDSVALFKVKNGDTIQLQWDVRAKDDSLAELHSLIAAIPDVVFATWNVYRLPLQVVGELGTFVNWTTLRYMYGEAILSDIHQHLVSTGMSAVNAAVYMVSGNVPIIFGDSCLFGTKNLPTVPYSSLWEVGYSGLLLSKLKNLEGEKNEAEVSTNKVFYGQRSLEGAAPNKAFIFDRSYSWFKQSLFYGKAKEVQVNTNPANFELDRSPDVLFLQQVPQFGSERDAVFDVHKIFFLDAKSKCTVHETHSLATDYYVNTYSDLDFVSDVFAFPNREFDFFKFGSFFFATDDQSFSAKPWTSNEDYTLVGYDVKTFNYEDQFANADYYCYTSANFTEKVKFSTAQRGSIAEEEFDYVPLSFGSIDFGILTPYTFSSNLATESFAFEVFSAGNLSQVKTESISSSYSHFYVDVGYEQYSASIVYGNLSPESSTASTLVTLDLVAADYRSSMVYHVPKSEYTIDEVFTEVQFFHESLGFIRQPVTHTKVAAKSEFFMHVEFSAKTNQDGIAAKDRGSFTEPAVQDFIDTDTIFEPGALSKYQLVDGTWMYYHLNRLKYGECVQHKYIVEHGLVRGG